MDHEIAYNGYIHLTITALHCPWCGNQTVYHYINQSVHYVCGCGRSFQLRTNERDKEIDRKISEMIQEMAAA